LGTKNTSKFWRPTSQPFGDGRLAVFYLSPCLPFRVNPFRVNPSPQVRLCHNYEERRGEERMKIFENRPYCLKFDMLYYGVITNMKGAQCYGISL